MTIVVLSSHASMQRVRIVLYFLHQRQNAPGKFTFLAEVSLHPGLSVDGRDLDWRLLLVVAAALDKGLLGSRVCPVRPREGGEVPVDLRPDVGHGDNWGGARSVPQERHGHGDGDGTRDDEQAAHEEPPVQRVEGAASTEGEEGLVALAEVVGLGARRHHEFSRDEEG